MPLGTQVLLLEVRGNLRHRIEKLGAELPWGDLSAPQRQLKNIAREQPWGGDAADGLVERPLWANGAFVYLTPRHAAEFLASWRSSWRSWRSSCRESCMPLYLETKHILVSEEYRALVGEVLSACPEGPGREAFLLRRAGVIDREDVIHMPFQA
jgi:hypothetical protein